MKIVVVTGMSGAGKRTALKFLEDAGFYCVDNLPVMLITKFVELAAAGKDGVSNIALGVDVRSGNGFSELENILDDIKQRGYNCKVVFLEADNEVLIKRYKETRRNHPLAGEDRVMEGIDKERKAVAFLKNKADYIIDTSSLLTRELKQDIEKIFVENENFNSLVVTILSFGFKYGIPEDADLVFDVRFLPNPYYIEELKQQTGNDKPIQDFVMKYSQSHIFLDKLSDMIEFLIPNYITEGKNRLVIAIGCTGGRHRSVTLANKLYDRMSGKDYGLKITHRDIDRDSHSGRQR